MLLIDTDSQSHATLVTTGRDDFDTTNSLYSVLMAERQSAPQVLADVIVQSGWDENLHVLPATPLLALTDRNRKKAYTGGQMYLIDRIEVSDMMRRYDVAQIQIDSPKN